MENCDDDNSSQCYDDIDKETSQSLDDTEKEIVRQSVENYFTGQSIVDDELRRLAQLVHEHPDEERSAITSDICLFVRIRLKEKALIKYNETQQSLNDGKRTKYEVATVKHNMSSYISSEMINSCSTDSRFLFMQSTE